MISERVALLLALLGMCVVSMNTTQFVSQFPMVIGATPAKASVFEALPSRAERSAAVLPSNPILLDNISAKSFYISYEQPNSRLLLQSNAFESLPLASLTKLMTALVVLESDVDWSVLVQILPEDIRGGSRSILKVGSEVSLEDLWIAMLVGSDNDAAATLARVVAGSEQEFVKLMNDRASRMGLQQTFFVEPSGLHAGNVSTAREFALIARTAFQSDKIRDTLAQNKAEVSVSRKPISLYNTDQRIRYLTGEQWQFLTGKTGYTRFAQYTTATLISTTGGVEALIVLLGSDTDVSRADEVRHLAEWALTQSR